jgi:Ni/Co efflux regulator RcnB
METKTGTFGTTVKKVLTALVCVVVLGGVAARPARADDGWGHHHERDRGYERDHEREREWREHRWHERHWREEHERPVYLYQPPRYGYAPPAVIYAVPAPPPSVNFVFPIR